MGELTRSAASARPQRGCAYRCHRRFALAVLTAWVVVGAPALAASSPRDLQLLAQTIGFLRDPPTGTIEVGIVYPPGSTVGRDEAEQIAREFQGGVHAGSVTLLPRIVTPGTAKHDPALKVLILTTAALPEAGSLAEAMAGRGVLTTAFGPAAVRSDALVMAIRSEPHVEIYLNRAAAQTTGTEFSTAFRMMIQER